MIKLLYTQIETVVGGDYDTYASDLRAKFGGDGVELTEAVADFCVQQDYCVYGGGQCLFACLEGFKGYYNSTDEIKMRWRDAVVAWDTAADRLAESGELDRAKFDSIDAWYKARWMFLFRFAEEREAAKRTAATEANHAAVASAVGPQVNPLPKVQVVTVAMLREEKACPSQISRFVATFGESAELTEENMARAIRANLDVNWLAGKAVKLGFVSTEHAIEYNARQANVSSECSAASRANVTQGCTCSEIATRILLQYLFPPAVTAPQASAQDAPQEAAAE